MDIAKGKYYYFMDSDDWAEPTMLEDMVALAEKTDAQLVVTGYYIDTYYSDTAYYTQEQKQPDALYESKEAFRRAAYALFDANLLYTPWNKLYSGDYLRENNLRFSNTFWDDFPFNLSVIRDIERVAVSSKKYYHFMRARAESETAKYHANMYEKREEEHRWMVELYDYWDVHDEASMEFVARRYIERVIGCIENVANPACELSRKEKHAEIRRIITSKTVRTQLPLMKARSKYMKLMLVPIRMKNTALTYQEGVVISSIRRKHTKSFAALKANR